ncbi:MAG: hypothetical protein QNI92_16565 [Desulfobacterales bacterium]|nr:hypothetical protein [Desulfobacterales bacterium]
MMELLILKSGNDYIRVTEAQFMPCGLDKASVFPMNQVQSVKSHLSRLKQYGFSDAAIFKLKLEEEPFENK